MPTLMKSIKMKANALTIGYLEEQLANVIHTHEQLTKLYQQKLHELDLLETQQQAVIDSARRELSELFTKIQEQKEIYSNIQNNIASFTGKAEGRRRKRKTKLKKIYRRKNKKRTKKRR